MTSLDKVTITGADDSTDIKEMLDLSAEYPFVEWGILASKSQEGSYRFPSASWQRKLMNAVLMGKMLNFCTHLCGKWVRDILQYGAPKGDVTIPALHISKRVQINTHAQPHNANLTVLYEALSMQVQTFIFQWDGVNDGISLALRQKGMTNIAALYDTSGGAGILPPAWPTAAVGLPVGYAGGIGPENLIGQLAKIEAAADGLPYWIDMERCVRSEDDSYLDMAKVRALLALAKRYKEDHGQ